MPVKTVVETVDPNTLTTEDKKKASEAVNLIKEKFNERIKGRTCANGIKNGRI